MIERNNFSNKEAWAKVDEGWRKGVEYIYSQLNTVSEEYGVKENDIILITNVTTAGRNGERGFARSSRWAASRES